MAREMKDSGIEWIGEIPREWEIKRIKYVAEFEPKCNMNELNNDSIVTYLPMLVSKKFALLKKPVNPSRFRTHPAVPELSALCIILAVFLKGGKNVSADSA